MNLDKDRNEWQEKTEKNRERENETNTVSEGEATA